MPHTPRFASPSRPADASSSRIPRRHVLAAAALPWLGLGAARAQEGAIRIAQSTALTGPLGDGTNLAGRLIAAGQRDEGFRGFLADSTREFANASLRWLPTDKIVGDLAFTYSREQVPFDRGRMNLDPLDRYGPCSVHDRRPLCLYLCGRG